MRRSDPKRFFSKCAEELRKAEGHRGQAAKALGTSLRTFHRYLAEHPEILKRAGKHGAARGGATPGEKATFVRKQPASMSVHDIVAKAKKSGLHLDENYVHIVRLRDARRKKANGGRRRK